MSDKFYNEDGSSYSYRDKKRNQKTTKKIWNEYYKDKQWIDTKGWCDLNGNPLPFGHDEVIKKKSSNIIINDSTNAYGLENPLSFLKRNKPHKLSKEPFKPQDHWEKYNIEKQWIDGKGWCDMDGVKIDSNYQPKKKSLKQPKISFRSIALKTTKITATLYGIYILSYLAHPNSMYTSYLGLVAVLVSSVTVLYYLFIIIVNMFKGNLKF